MSSSGLMERIAREVTSFLRPLEGWAASDTIAGSLVELGLAPPNVLLGAPPLTSALSRVISAATVLPSRVEELDEAANAGDPTQILAAVTALLAAGDDAMDAVRDAGAAMSGLASTLTELPAAQRDELREFAAAVPKRLLHRLLVDYLEQRVPRLTAALLGIGCIEIVDESSGGDGSLRVPYLRRTVRFDRLLQLFTDPEGLLRDAYGWGAAGFDGMALFRTLKTLLERYFAAPSEILTPPGMPPSLEAFGLRLQVNDQVSPPGLDASLRTALDVDVDQTFTTDGWDFVLRLLARCAADTDATLRPFADVQLHAGLTADLVARWQASRPGTAEPIVLLGTSGASRLEARAMGGSLSLEAHWDASSGRATLEPVVQGYVHGAKLVVEELGIDHTFDVDFKWSPSGGLEFAGGQIGPVTFERIALGGSAVGGALTLAAHADATIDVGPLILRLEHAGVEVMYETGSGFGGIQLDWTLPTVQLRLTKGSDALPIELTGFFLSGKCIALRWREHEIGRWLRQLSSDLGDQSPTVESEMTLRILLEDGAEEVRLDWLVEGAGRTIAVPGFKVATPEDAQLTLMLGGSGRLLTEVMFGLTFAKDAILRAMSSFAWERGDENETTREIQTDSERPEDKALLQLEVKALAPATLVLLNFRLDQAHLPEFLKQLEAPVTPLDFSNTDQLQSPTAAVLQSMTSANWSAVLHVNPDELPFTLPFLQGGSGDSDQFLQVDPLAGSIEADLSAGLIRFPIGVRVVVGPMSLSTTIDLEFKWETFAFAVRHSEGLKLCSEESEIVPTGDNGEPVEHMGLLWRFKGAPITIGGVQNYHYFTLATENHNYQLLQAPGAVFEVEYSELSEEGIGFSNADFRLTPKGVSLTATVIDRPAKLNGIDTRFRFQDTQLVIVENRITDFTLKGSGPLPPALVGDATADIALQLAQRGGKLTLVSGGARLKGSKLLDCPGTRFQFSIDAIGVKFVNEGKFHLYFTLTGSAQFKLAAGDDAQGALAFLPNIRIDLVECPLAGDARAIAKHINFLIELPRPLSFSFLGAFEMELRGIGFVPQAEVFDGDGAMLITGQLKFAQGAGDASDSRTDLHKLYIGLPKPGGIFPRIHFANLPIHLNLGSAFQLNGVVDFVDSALEKGFSGEGTLTIQGLPTIAAAFAFLRVRRDETSPWVRAWFIYLEVRKISFQIPVVNVYLREVGLGFGYRFTLVSLRAADEANDVRKLIGELTKLSRTQGDLSKRDRWALDLEPAGQDPRWTVALRAMISQTTSQKSPLQYNEDDEKQIACLFLLDAVIALRSDLTFLMTMRGWLFANYHDYVTDWKGIRGKPPISGFVLLSPRHKRLLAHAASNPGGLLGQRPPLPDFVQRALSKSQFSTTLLVEPGLLHTEMGWPNQLRWADKYGPINAEFRGGFLFRVSRDELVTGTSFLARARLSIGKEVNLGVVGLKVSAEASIAFGARYIGLINLRDPLEGSALYGGIGIEALIKFLIEFWIRLKIGFVKITKKFRFSRTLEFTAGLEIGLVGISTSGIGVRGSGHLAIDVMGRRFSFSVHFGLNEDAVQTALDRTSHVLALGLEATDVEAIPGTTGTGTAGAARLASVRARAKLLSTARTVPAPRAGSSSTADEILHVPVIRCSSFARIGATSASRATSSCSPPGRPPTARRSAGFCRHHPNRRRT